MTQYRNGFSDSIYLCPEVAERMQQTIDTLYGIESSDFGSFTLNGQVVSALEARVFRPANGNISPAVFSRLLINESWALDKEDNRINPGTLSIDMQRIRGREGENTTHLISQKRSTRLFFTDGFIVGSLCDTTSEIIRDKGLAKPIISTTELERFHSDRPCLDSDLLIISTALKRFYAEASTYGVTQKSA